MCGHNIILIFIKIPMNWIQTPIDDFTDQRIFLSKLDKFTLYDHNYFSTVDLNALTFSCVFNCKRINRQYSIIAKIQGNLLSRNFQIICSLVNFTGLFTAKWQHHKIELTKFAIMYNQRSGISNYGKMGEPINNYQIKVNPLSGQFYVCFHSFMGYEILKDYEKFKMKMTDQCQRLGEQAQKIFNTVMKVIFDQQANDPYLKSNERVGMNFSRPVKINQLLGKIKKMNAISYQYKIRQDISNQNKYRSSFKKVYLKRYQKCITNPFITETAMVYSPKFTKKNHDAVQENASSARKKNIVIPPFEDLQDNYQTDFSQHLQDSMPMTGSAIINLRDMISQEMVEAICNTQQPQIYEIAENFRIYVEPISQTSFYHERRILRKLKFKHNNIFQHYCLEGMEQKHLRIIEAPTCMSLLAYLQKFRCTLSLQTRLHIIVQICHVIQILHKNNIGYFIDIHDIYITEDNVVKVKNFTPAYSCCNWDQLKGPTTRLQPQQQNIIMENFHRYRVVCGRKSDDPIIKQNKSEDQRDRFESQRADIYSLGFVLYRVLLDKFPFSPNCWALFESQRQIEKIFPTIWTVETESFLQQGGMLAKLLAQLILQCFYQQSNKRPYVEWLVVIFAQVKSTLKFLY